jgi:hypothetical protein
LNGLTAQVQYFATGTSGTDFAISSATATHTFNLPVASASNTGKLSSTDWSTFNSKANALSGTINTIAYWNSATTISSLALTTYPSLTELSYVKGVTSSIQTQIGTKQATITLTTTGTSGAATLVGATLNIPQYIGGVTSVFGRTGAVVATSGDYTTAQVTESGNLYFTDSRARLALSFVAGSGAYNSTTGVITIPTNNNQITNGAGYTTNVGTVTSVAASGGTGISITGSPITTSGTITITNTLPDQTVALTASTGISVTGTYPNFTITNTSPSSGGTVTSVGLSSATSGVTIGSTPVTTSGTITLAIATATTSQNGLLSSTDWTTFNNKQNALTNPVTGSGGANYIAKWNTSSTITNSLIYDNATQVGINTTTMVSLFDVTKNALGTTIVDTSGITLKNGTEALTGVQQISPALHFKSNGWSTTALASQSSDWIMYNLPIQGTNVSNHLIFASAVNGAAYATRLTLTSVGNATFTGSVTALSLVKSGGTSAEILAADGSVITAGTNITISGGSISASGGVTGTGTTNYLPKFTSASTIGDSLIFNNGVNTYIGESGNSQGFWLKTNTTSGSAVEIGAYAFGTNSYGDLVFNTSDSANGRMRITAAGLAGIGTNTPDRLLHLNSTTGDAIIRLERNSAAITSGQSYGQLEWEGQDASTGAAGVRSSIDVLSNGTLGETNLVFRTSGSNFNANLDRLTIDSSGNLGLGVTPSAWNGITALQIGGYASFGGDSSFVTYVSSNAYYNAGWKYIGVSAAANYYQDAGTHYFRSTSTTGTAGGAITWITPLTIAASGAATFSGSVTTTNLIASSSLNGDPALATFTNANGGSSAEATIYIRNSASSADSTFIQALGTAFTTTGGFVQDGGVIGSSTGLSGGLSLMVRANADMRFYTNGHTNERMRITSGGNVLIGTTTDSGYKLEVNGQVRATAFFESSDKRLKKEISENPTIDGISQIKPKLYIKDGKEELGYYAQDLEQVLPSSVSEGKDGFLALSYTQVHTAKIAQLESKIEQLEKLIYELGRNK